jgi:FkbM family methyltransferase
MKRLLRKMFKKFGLSIIQSSELKKLYQNSLALQDIKILQRLNGDNAKHLLQYFSKSRSQLRQDLFVLNYFAFKRDGYFIEFGATNGLDLSNTFLMEKEFGWKGILAEPASHWHTDLKKNRSCHIEMDCVWRDSTSTLTFNQVAPFAELSTISSFSDADSHKDIRKKGKIYEVKAISLNDLLKKYKAPKHIDYLSIDTEGSEYEILSHFDFSKYTFEVITCEHNFTPMRDKLYSLLTRNGYQRVFEDISLFDDWYIKSNE